MIGFRSGLLTVVGRGFGLDPKRAYWLCQCACGGQHTVMGKYLRKNEVKSCGCLNRAPLMPRTTHGMTPSKGKKPRVYNTWASMKDRCLNTSNPKWIDYGGRGIRVCDRWLDFSNFYADMGAPPPGSSIDRIDNSKGYCPENCRWATPKQQANNTRTNRWIEFDGQHKTLTSWARYFSVPTSTLYCRIERSCVDVVFKQLSSKV